MQACGFLISIHALRVEGDGAALRRPYTRALISIHALRVEGDGERHAGYNIKPEISIHALRVEGDLAFVNTV